MTLLQLVLLSQLGIVFTITLHEDFELIATNKKLTGYDIQTMQVRSLVQCSAYCSLISECYSFNYITRGLVNECEMKSAWCLDSTKAPLVTDGYSVYYAVKSVTFGKHSLKD